MPVDAAGHVQLRTRDAVAHPSGRGRCVERATRPHPSELAGFEQQVAAGLRRADARHQIDGAARRRWCRRATTPIRAAPPTRSTLIDLQAGDAHRRHRPASRRIAKAQAIDENRRVASARSPRMRIDVSWPGPPSRAPARRRHRRSSSAIDGSRARRYRPATTTVIAFPTSSMRCGRAAAVPLPARRSAARSSRSSNHLRRGRVERARRGPARRDA